jgi:hypothetical protein
MELTFEKRFGSSVPGVSRRSIPDGIEANAALIHQKNGITVLCRKALTEPIAMVHCGVD